VQLSLWSERWRERPDIRMLNPRCGGPVTIEIKIAERWKLADLREDLETQLVGTYMRANNSLFGVFLVCSSGPKKDGNNGSLDGFDFAQVIAELREDATRIKSMNPAVRGLEVIGIDFHAPPGKRRQRGKGSGEQKAARSKGTKVGATPSRRPSKRTGVKKPRLR
jgi:hypothetical protein